MQGERWRFAKSPILGFLAALEERERRSGVVTPKPDEEEPKLKQVEPEMDDQVAEHKPSDTAS